MGQVKSTWGLPEICAAGGPAGFGVPRLGDHVLGCCGVEKAPDIHVSGGVVGQSGGATGDVLGESVGVSALLQVPPEGLTEDPAAAPLLLWGRWASEVHGSGHVACVSVCICVYLCLCERRREFRPIWE